ncbi:hypothetical protein PLESTB_000512000 [Pleodorina starrii]|uniref:Uncharacterized protein n=1 Tax=Pleodorina starrii TaxID=330485 RepID=A0A9W6F0V2_9CHLO|nr:hypothetical protein PLESTM_000127100 [Pleodorina starrii]GLC51526.1 hypothetical protein PLESTB_000512000 [Pleodorina starrii]GLC75042.1 hypothetical protein PLESTF_001586600 [Pleodorina starrii]
MTRRRAVEWLAGAGWRCMATAAPGAARQQPHHQIQKKLGLKDVQHIVAITSAKGGVGKSTTAVNVAVAMATRLGLRVGLLDADIHGPSIPTLMNLRGKPELDKAGSQALMLPKENFRVKTMSFGFFLEGDEPVVWRGPMVNNAFDKMLFGTQWGPLDVLVVDMPPGTGDAQINLGQRIPLSGAALVSTPQDVALIDVRRGAQMFLKLRVPLLGLIENMSHHTCSKCGHVERIFGAGGVQRAASDYGLEVLGEVPLHVDIQAKSDAGTPVVASDPRGDLAAAYSHIAERIHSRLQQLGSSQTAAPKITVE